MANCKACKGTGDCQNCGGKGYKVGALINSKCQRCDGTGKCTVCDGKGKS